MQLGFDISFLVRQPFLGRAAVMEFPSTNLRSLDGSRGERIKPKEVGRLIFQAEFTSTHNPKFRGFRERSEARSEMRSRG